MKTNLILFLFSLVLFSCTQQDNPFAYQSDTHSRGKAVVYIEESFQRLFDTSIYTFESQFPKADIVPKYLSENEIIDAFYKDSTKTIVISREFTKEELAYLKSKKVEVRSNKIAIDAIALIVHPSNSDTMMTLNQFKDILKGKQKTWNSTKNPIKIVFDHIHSANYNYINQLIDNQISKENTFAAQSNEEVIEYVKNTPSSIGIIGLNWISDLDDSNVLNFLKGIKIVSIAAEENSKYFQPYPGFIYTKEYPLTRDIWIINKGKKSGIHTGFVLFMSSEKGQTIVQKESLVPATAPVRLIQFK